MTVDQKSSQLPSRYEQVLNKRFAEAMDTLRRSPSTPTTGTARRPWWLIAGSIVAGLAVTTMRLFPTITRSSVPFAASNTVQVMGLSQGAGEFLPLAAPPPPPAASLESVPTPKPVGTRVAGVVTRADESRFGIALPDTLASVEETDAGTVAYLRAAPKVEEAVLFDDETEPNLTIAVDHEQDQPRRVVNLGSRVPATLVYPVRTGPAPVPVTARINEEVRVGDHTAIKAGSLLVGSAIATRESDRVQMAFSALVQDGLTVRFQGVALGADGEMGVAGRLIRKGTTGRRWASRAAGAVGAALSLDLARKTSGLTGTAARELASDVDRDFDYFERNWGEGRSDKVVEAASGTAFLVSLGADLVVP
jgi:hypothetical protein